MFRLRSKRRLFLTMCCALSALFLIFVISNKCCYTFSILSGTDSDPSIPERNLRNDQILISDVSSRKYVNLAAQPYFTGPFPTSAHENDQENRLNTTNDFSISLESLNRYDAVPPSMIDLPNTTPTGISSYSFVPTTRHNEIIVTKPRFQRNSVQIIDSQALPQFSYNNQLLETNNARPHPIVTLPRIPQRPKNVSRLSSPHYPWGSHEFGPLEMYMVAPDGYHWVAYFNHEAIAVVLEAQNRVVINCTLLEVIPSHEQRAALKALGQVMPLKPLSLPQMVLLNTYCSTPHDKLPQSTSGTPRTVFSHDAKSADELALHASSALQGILPGTYWCGLSDKAKVFHELGYRTEIDRCCRAHDHCPVKLRAGVTRYGATNNGFSTMSHCSCDKQFFKCLEEATAYDDVASMVGNLFFNILRPRCLVTVKSYEDNLKEAESGRDLKSLPSSLVCVLSDSLGNCRQWISNSEVPDLTLKVVRPKFNFTHKR